MTAAILVYGPQACLFEPPGFRHGADIASPKQVVPLVSGCQRNLPMPWVFRPIG
jgi:hypothetical protein